MRRPRYPCCPGDIKYEKSERQIRLLLSHHDVDSHQRHPNPGPVLLPVRGDDTSSSEQRPPSEGLTLDFDLVVSIALGVGLAAATGLRVYMPMLVVSAAAYTGHLPWALTSRGSERHPQSAR